MQTAHGKARGCLKMDRVGGVCQPDVYLFFSLPRGMTAVIGAMGRSDVEFLGSEVSFLGFFAIFSLR